MYISIDSLEDFHKTVSRAISCDSNNTAIQRYIDGIVGSITGGWIGLENS
ncbi:hypothetical protein Igag_0995 [Ignisphaera aggregans DSM 17230]|uniref:Uncharacterized protein n=1 Tax=Ignisphaera aggregans (strain DSM 17230 / JCM 13409 / AQ1.S1) TaxID=583356 RepID=E0SNL4_IGNAA|nr:hypothetical protein Igag_0995 [Ignisphaera aggregans DSM 17230]